MITFTHSHHLPLWAAVLAAVLCVPVFTPRHYLTRALAWLSGALRAARSAPGREPQRDEAQAPALLRHPSVLAAMTGPLPCHEDAELSAEEERVLDEIEAAVLGIPAPRDGSGR